MSLKSIEQSLRDKLQAAYAPEFLYVQNDSHGHSRGNETHYTVVVVSPFFAGKSRVDRQREVAALFDEERTRSLCAKKAWPPR